MKMREILFRAKRKDNGEWVEGCPLFHDGSDCTMLRQHPETGGLDGIEVYPETVSQYTGLMDKNGVRIFEGDIVSEKSYVYEHAGTILCEVLYAIEYGEAAFWTFDNCDRPIESLSIWESQSKLKVEGNVWDTHNLLKR